LDLGSHKEDSSIDGMLGAALPSLEWLINKTAPIPAASGKTRRLMGVGYEAIDLVRRQA
jgi:hypothetical protein